MGDAGLPRAGRDRGLRRRIGLIEHREDQIDDIPAHVNDKNGHISLVLMGAAMVLLLLLVVFVVQAM